MGGLDDSWWEALAGRLLHLCQIEIIDILRRNDEPLTAPELFEACKCQPEWMRFVQLLRRLQNLGAVAPAELPPDSNPFVMRYRLRQPPRRVARHG